MRPAASKARATAACLALLAALSACHHDPVVGSGDPRPQTTDSLEGIVRVVGSTGSSEVVLRTDDAQSMVLRGSELQLLSRVSGLRVLVRGNRTAGRMNVTAFRVLAANGVAATDGRLMTDGSLLVLMTADGRLLPVARPSVGLRAAIGHRVWISGPLDGETIAYGVIE